MTTLAASVLALWILVHLTSAFPQRLHHDEQMPNSIDLEDLVNQDSEVIEEDDPTLSSGYFEGDIVGVNVDGLSGRNAINADEKMWPQATIPYDFQLLAFSLLDRQMIKFAMDEFHENTCIRFVPRKHERDYVRFIRGKGCYSNVGRYGSRQDISIGDGCLSKGIIMHELNHAVGFWHEQSRPDRDKYVIIKWKNIQKGTEGNFAKYPLDLVQNLNEQYDYNSLMHYGPYSFTRYKSRKTIEVRKRVSGLKMGQRVGFTSTDLRKINKLYNCTEFLKLPVEEQEKTLGNVAGEILTAAASFAQGLVDRLISLG